jgi:flagellar hook protein FlgE
MSITRTLNTGASGLRSHAEAIGVVGDNIANVNTVGFKRQRAGFEDMLGRAVAGSSNMAPTAGAGSKLGHIEQMWSQGALLTTDSPTDLAIAGNGFFVVEGQANGQQGQYYTRAGQFSLDQNGNLVNPHGLNLMGYVADASGTMGTTPTALNVAGAAVPARVTSRVDMAVQLDATETVPAAPWDPADAEGTSNFQQSITVYDSLGNSHEVTAYFRKNTDTEWEWHALVDGAELAGGTPGTPTEMASGTLTFTTTGALDTETPGASSWDFAGAAGGQAIAFDFGTSITGDGGTGLEGTTMYAAPSTVVSKSQDGYAAGTVSSVGVDSDGTITGAFTNGQRRVLGQVALANFGSVDGLERMGNGMWTATNDSGEALIGAAETGGRGSIVSGALEGSNVDIGTEFVNLIAYQRGFQANSRIITTADEVYSELVSLKR